MTVALTIGTFDPPHLGHANLFRQARLYGDDLIVGVNSDRFVEEYRGAPPMYSEKERMAFVAPHANFAALNDGPGAELIKMSRCDALVVGNDWLERDYLAQIGMTAEELQEFGIALVYVPRLPGLSASDMKERLR